MSADPTTPPAGRSCVVCHTEHATIAEAQACGNGSDLDNHRRRLEDACRLAQSSDVEHLRTALNSATITAGDLLADAYKLRDEVEHLRAAPSTQPVTPDDVYQRAARAYLLGINLVATDPLLRELAGDAGFRAAVDAGREDLTRRVAELEAERAAAIRNADNWFKSMLNMVTGHSKDLDVADRLQASTDRAFMEAQTQRDQARAERDEQKALADHLVQQVTELQGQLAITKGSNT